MMDLVFHFILLSHLNITPSVTGYLTKVSKCGDPVPIHKQVRAKFIPGFLCKAFPKS